MSLPRKVNKSDIREWYLPRDKVRGIEEADYNIKEARKEGKEAEHIFYKAKKKPSKEFEDNILSARFNNNITIIKNNTKTLS